MAQLAPLLVVLLLAGMVQPVGEDRLPMGKPGPLPEPVDWDLSGAVTGKTPRRQRITLRGLWRFAPATESNTRVLRSEMGWILMPALWARTDAKVFAPRFRLADGVWQGRPLKEFEWAWAERDITAPFTWIKYRVFYKVRGPWARAEVYVFGELLKGVQRDGARWFDITGSLMYPGTTQISMWLKAPVGETADAVPTEAEPYVGLELLPVGPRVEAIRLRQDARRGEILARLDLVRPVGFPILGGAAIRTLPMAVQLKLQDAVTGATLKELSQNIGPMPNHTRSVTLRIPWSARKDLPPPERARLHVHFGPARGGIFDVPFPREFQPAKLQAAEGKSGEPPSL